VVDQKILAEPLVALVVSGTSLGVQTMAFGAWQSLLCSCEAPPALLLVGIDR